MQAQYQTAQKAQPVLFPEKNLVTDTTLKGVIICTSKVTGIIHKEASKKRWRRINKSTCKACGGLMVVVKVPMADGGHREYITKRGSMKQ
jgi:hypothetical protein